MKSRMLGILCAQFFILKIKFIHSFTFLFYLTLPFKFLFILLLPLLLATFSLAGFLSGHVRSSIQNKGITPIQTMLYALKVHLAPNSCRNWPVITIPMPRPVVQKNIKCEKPIKCWWWKKHHLNSYTDVYFV